MPNSISTTSNTTTLANQALKGSHDDGLSIVQNKHRKVIDLTSPDDDEVILISAFDLKDIACDIDNAATVISDIGKLLGLIHYEKIDALTAISMARLTHDTAETWVNLLQAQLDGINDTLAMTAYANKEVEK